MLRLWLVCNLLWSRSHQHTPHCWSPHAVYTHQIRLWFDSHIKTWFSLECSDSLVFVWHWIRYFLWRWINQLRYTSVFLMPLLWKAWVYRNWIVWSCNFRPYRNSLWSGKFSMNWLLIQRISLTFFHQVCPICASLPGGEPNQVTEDFAAHLTMEHRGTLTWYFFCVATVTYVYLFMLTNRWYYWP